jgi:hypothetical protein
MKGIIGCNAGYLEPGEIIDMDSGASMTVIRKVDLQAAIEAAHKLGDTGFKPVEGEHFYEVEVERFAPVSNN